MKYLKLYEGFKSNKVSAILSFINGKIKNYNTPVFLEKLKEIAQLHDFPLSSLSDEEIQYLPVNKALLVGKDEEAMNPSGVYCIKYWFSLDKGYLCSTGVGNKTMDYNKYNIYGSSKISNQILNSSHLSQLVKEYNIGGILIPVKLRDLKTGDKVVMSCDSSLDNAGLTLGEIYLDDRDDEGQYYFYQNEHEGSTPDHSINRISLPERYNFESSDNYIHSWSLGSVDNESMDHSAMHKLIPDDKILRFSDEDLTKISAEVSTWDFNLPFNNKNNLIEWSYQNEKNLNQINKEANFAIILFLDDIIIKNVDEPRSEISNRRKSGKEGALALRNPDDIKRENVERYLNTIFKKLGIGLDKQELKNLNSIVLSSILGDYFIINLYSSGNSNIDRLSNFISYLYRLMSGDDEDAQFNFKKVHDLFTRIRGEGLKTISAYTNGINFIKEVDTESAKRISDIIKRTIKIGKIFSNSIKNRNIETIEDLKLVQVRLSTLQELIHDEIFVLSKRIKKIFEYFAYLGPNKNSLSSHSAGLLDGLLSEYSEEDYKKDSKRLDSLEKQLKTF